MAAEQGSAARLVEVALAEVGTIEGPKDNETKYGKFAKANFQPWCGSFVMWCADQAGVKVPNTVYTPAGAQAFIKAGAWQMAEVATPEVGDIAYFDFPSDGVDRISHVGIVGFGRPTFGKPVAKKVAAPAAPVKKSAPVKKAAIKKPM